MNREEGSRSKTTRTLARLGLTAGASAVSLLMMLGAAGLAGAHAHPSFGAPYHGTVQLSNSGSMGGCAGSKVVQAAHFKLLTGVGGFEDTAKEAWCASAATPPTIDSVAAASSEFQVSLKVVAPTTASHTVTAKWSIKSSWSEGLTISACALTSVYSWCQQYAQADLYTCAYVYDSTNGSYLYPSSGCTTIQSNYTYNETVCYNVTTCYYYAGGAPGSGSVSGTYTLAVTGGMVATHLYFFEVYVGGFAYASSETYNTTMLSSSAGYAMENVNTNSPPGDYAKLVSVVVT
ncbi:MAG: hypothetical protein ACHQ2Y_04725 [Candidatus Lutacidiplasmatales archaeon]